MFFDVRLDGIVIAEFESRDVGAGVEEKRLAVASVLQVQQ